MAPLTPTSLSAWQPEVPAELIQQSGGEQGGRKSGRNTVSLML